MNFAITLILSLLSLVTFGQVNFTAQVSKDMVQTGERFVLKLEANTNFSKFEPPNFANFSVVSGPNQSSSMSWVNGQMTASKSYTYYLVANKEGKFKIGEAKIEADGKIYTSNPIEIEVIKGQQTTPQQKQQGTRQQNQSASNIDDNLFMRLLLSKNKGVVGEQIIATYKLYTRVELSGIVDNKEPKNSGFWKEDVKLPERTQFTQENINGQVFNTAIVKQTVLLPQKSGKLTVDPLELTFRVRVQDNTGGRRQSLFDQFFGRFVEKDVLVKTNSATITIDSPPNLSKNLDYSGGVGQFKFTAKADKSELKSNEAFNFDLSVSGTGNIQLLELPKVEFPADFEVYDPKITDKKSVTSNGISGRKTYNYLIIPRHSGEFTIPALQFTYYDTQTKNYKTITQGPFEITVEKGNNEEETTAIYNGNNKEDLKIIGSDIRYIHTNTTLNASKSPFFNTLPYYLCLAAPFLLLGIFLGGRKQIASANLDTIGNRRKKATKVATRKLASAKKHLEQNEKDAFFEEVIHAIYGYFEDKFNIAAADIGLEVIEEKLNTINFDSEQTTQLKGIIEKCEMARFAPITDNTPEGIYEETLTIISNIEAQVK